MVQTAVIPVPGLPSMASRAGAVLLALGCWSCGSSGTAAIPDAAGTSHEAGPPDAGARDARPVDADGDGRDAPAHSVVTVPLTGCSQGTYLAEVELGGAQRFELALDTGSTTLGVAALGCKTCGVSPEYAPGSHAVDEHVPVMSLYGDGTEAGATGWSGEVYEDTVSVGKTVAASTRMRFAAIGSQSQFFYPVTCGSSVLPHEGILGFAPVKDALPGTDAYFDKLVAARSLPDVFATELCDPGGHLWLGGYDLTYVTAPPGYTPYSSSMNRNYAYVVDMQRVVVEGISVDVATPTYGDTILDTGNSSFFLPPAAFATVTSAIATSAGFLAAFGADGGAPDGGGSFFSETSSCATTTQTKAQLDAALPPITLVFGSSPSITVTAVATEAYLIPFGGGVWCPALLPLAPDTAYPFVASLGAPILRSSVVIFDRQHGRIGFAPHKPCP